MDFELNTSKLIIISLQPPLWNCFAPRNEELLHDYLENREHNHECLCNAGFVEGEYEK